ncbi:MAG: sigma-70 family RNA polymerase sigma factor [Pseudomonadota bacterium]
MSSKRPSQQSPEPKKIQDPSSVHSRSLESASSAGVPVFDDALTNAYKDYAKELVNGIRRTFGAGPPDPEDVAQEAFHKLYERGDIDSIRNLRAFLWRTARNIVLVAKRKADVRAKYDFEIEQLFFSPAGDNSSPERIISAREQLSAINACLRNMPVRRRRAFMLYRVEGLSMEEVGRRLGLSRSGAAKHVARADHEINLLFFQEE